MKLTAGKTNTIGTVEEIICQNDNANWFARMVQAGMIELEKGDRLPVLFEIPKWVPTCPHCGSTDLARFTLVTLEARHNSLLGFVRTGGVLCGDAEFGNGCDDHPARKPDVDEVWLYCNAKIAEETQPDGTTVRTYCHKFIPLPADHLEQLVWD